LPVSEDVRIGTELLGYRFEELVGRGGMGVVYRATDLRLERQVALKLLAPRLARDERFRRRFLAESQVATSLEHPHILPVYDAGEANGLLYIAMRYVEESDLKRLLRNEAPLTPARTLELLGEVADALDVAHERGLTHRDVKPSNILISLQAGREHSYLADFGLTQRTGDGGTSRATTQIVGTVDYMAPEQIEREDVDPRADVYALGCVLYECLTGEVPFPHDSDLAVLWAHMRADPPRASERRAELPQAIDGVIAKALAKAPEKRYGSCGELVKAARDALGLSDVLVVRQRTPLLLVAGGLVITIAAAAAFALSGGGGSALALRGNTLVRIDPTKNRVSAVIDVGEKPAGVAVAAGGTAWVYNLGDATVSQIDTSTNSVKRTTSISTGPFTAAYHSGPLLAANSAGAWLVGVRPDGTGLLTRVGVDGGRQEFLLDSSPVGVAASETAVWVLGTFSAQGRCPVFWDWEHRPLPASVSDTVLRLSPSTGRVLDRVPLRRSCGTITGIAHDDRWVWLFEYGFSELVRVDARTSRVSGIADLGTGAGAGVGGGAPAPGGGAVWVHATDQGGRLVSVDRNTLRMTGAISSVPSRFGSISYADRSLWWNDAREGMVLRFDPETGRIVSSLRVAPESSRRRRFHSSAITTGADAVWVTVTPAFLP
jgi:YVTN family beta-propeller protein